jgi:hypothetical protein
MSGVILGRTREKNPKVWCKDTDRVSRTIYERWIQHAIPRDEIERAINEVRDDFTIEATPKAIDDLLRRWKKGTGRGRVAL